MILVLLSGRGGDDDDDVNLNLNGAVKCSIFVGGLEIWMYVGLRFRREEQEGKEEEGCFEWCA